MPTFYVDEIDISPSEFVNACSARERQELINFLSKNGYIDINDSSPSSRRISAPESIFEDSLNAIHGNWNMLSSVEEEIIMKIASRFK